MADDGFYPDVNLPSLQDPHMEVIPEDHDPSFDPHMQVVPLDPMFEQGEIVPDVRGIVDILESFNIISFSYHLDC